MTKGAIMVETARLKMKTKKTSAGEAMSSNQV